MKLRMIILSRKAGRKISYRVRENIFKPQIWQRTSMKMSQDNGNKSKQWAKTGMDSFLKRLFRWQISTLKICSTSLAIREMQLYNFLNVYSFIILLGQRGRERGRRGISSRLCRCQHRVISGGLTHEAQGHGLSQDQELDAPPLSRPGGPGAASFLTITLTLEVDVDYIYID